MAQSSATGAVRRRDRGLVIDVLSTPRQDTAPSLAERLNGLFAAVGWTDRHGRHREYSTAEVAKAVTADPSSPATLSRSYLAMLRSGAHTNPSLAVLEALATFFNDRRPSASAEITVRDLVGREDPEDELLRRQLADRQVRAIALRAGAMTPAMRAQLLKMIEIFDQGSGSADDTEG
jgi:transcriptional regulator with XRE-family HTH domain